MRKSKDEWFSGLKFIEKIPERLYVLPDFHNMIIKEELSFARYAKWVKFENPKTVIFYSKSKKKIYDSDNNPKVLGFTTFDGGGFIIFNTEKNRAEKIHSAEYGFVKIGSRLYLNTLLKTESNIKKIQNYFETLEKLQELENQYETLKNELYDTFLSDFEELQTIFPKRKKYE